MITTSELICYIARDSRLDITERLELVLELMKGAYDSSERY